MPALANISVGSLGGTTGPLGTTSWPLRAKKFKKALRMSAAVRVDIASARHLAHPAGSPRLALADLVDPLVCQPIGLAVQLTADMRELDALEAREQPARLVEERFEAR